MSQSSPSMRHFFKSGKGKYWLYAALGCPFAHRSLIARSIKNLNDYIGVSITHWYLGKNGWRFLEANEEKMGDNAYRYDGGIRSTEDDTSTRIGDIPDHSNRLFVDGSFDPNYKAKSMKDLYLRSDPNYSGKFSVPILWDLTASKIVNNDSGEIIRCLNSIGNEIHKDKKTIDLAPSKLIPELDTFNSWLQENINMGVYKIGLATKQSEFESNLATLYRKLNECEDHLKGVYKDIEKEVGKNNKVEILKKFYLFGNQITDTDIRFYTTAIRFDSSHAQHLKCNWRIIRDDYPYIHLWLRNLYWNHKAFRLTTNFNHIKLFYSRSQKKINPSGITPLGPEFDILKL
ncbi:hypothetical protein KAFR_0A04880 [Kazachstania africana CBS 2517]|uniref:GST N-terminal domain-containing protein n=1 Tax=Kazachstania africana (strain ATCC 22294 / BCRC 22015 / CBS 2517 / CECT 1963 / NBRC 1671 / NRRL Y-8276) TaxID=1071382 RepID=H2ANH4_KAZAF|nr:hypothetical protein KAFR_0A04880 [Kazachstania africana CBS 2517]CCF55924.1 hypothetical protein KAFR_0A04880 [Kazachstania africana CBS 2517]